MKEIFISSRHEKEFQESLPALSYALSKEHFLAFPKHHAFGGWNFVMSLLHQASRRRNDTQLLSTVTTRRANIEAKSSVMLMTVCGPDQENISKQRNRRSEINYPSSTTKSGKFTMLGRLAEQLEDPVEVSQAEY